MNKIHGLHLNYNIISINWHTSKNREKRNSETLIIDQMMLRLYFLCKDACMFCLALPGTRKARETWCMYYRCRGSFRYVTFCVSLQRHCLTAKEGGGGHSSYLSQRYLHSGPVSSLILTSEQRDLKVRNKQGTQQQRPESSTITPPECFPVKYKIQLGFKRPVSHVVSPRGTQEQVS